MPRPTRQPSRQEVAADELAEYDRVIKRAADPDRSVFVIAQQMKAGDGSDGPVPVQVAHARVNRAPAGARVPASHRRSAGPSR